VSAHIKRLEAILGTELFDRSGPSVSLTAKGELIVGYAHRILSINDLILHVAKPGPSAREIRIGVPPDFVGRFLPGLLVDFRTKWPELRFSVYHADLDRHLRELQHGNLDLAIGFSLEEPAGDARHHWTEQMVWVRGHSSPPPAASTVPLVAFRDGCVYHRAATDALKRAGRESELVFKGPTIVSLAAAVNAGLGIMALPRSRGRPPQLMVWKDAPLPPLPEVFWGVYLSEGAERRPLEDLADSIAAELRGRTAAANGLQVDGPDSGDGPDMPAPFS
jgi:DNA-binding transcriptional LysR family regulator